MTAKTKTRSNGLSAISENADPTQVVTINFVADGFTALGNVWYRGQEISVLKGSSDWDRTVNTETGESWLEYDEDTQIDRFGERFFREGKWAGKGYDIEDPDLTDEQRAQLAAAVAAAGAEGAPAEKRGPGRPRKPAPAPPKIG